MSVNKLLVCVPPLSQAHRDMIQDAAKRHDYDAAFFQSVGEAIPYAADATVIFSMFSSLARHAPRLKWQCTPSAGINQFAGEGVFASPDAVLSNSSGAYGVTIAEHIVMVLLNLLRRQNAYRTLLEKKSWRNDIRVASVQDSSILFLGAGDIATEAAKRLRAFAPKRMVALNRSGKGDTALFDAVHPIDRLDQLLPESDVVILSLPGTPATDNILSAPRLALLPDGACLINVGRGNAIDEDALLKELRARRLYAALDVFKTEPLPADHPFWNMENLYITSHAAGNMTLPYTEHKIVCQFLADFERFVLGQPLQKAVDIKRGY